MEKTLAELCAAVVTAQVQGRQMTSEEITESIRNIYGTLDALNRAACQPLENSLVALRREPKQSLQKDHVICLECGKKFHLLSNRHVALHNLTPREYKRKWSIPQTTALSARTLTARRRKLSKQMGMGKELAAWRATRKQAAG